MNRWVKNTMKFPNRPVRTVLALAVCQLLLACAQPNRNNFVSHFSEASSAQDFSFAADEADGSVKTGKKKSESDESQPDRKSTRLNSSHSQISYAVFCLKKKKYTQRKTMI